MDEKELEEYFKIYTMYWKLFKRFSTLDGTDDYWRRLIHEVQAIHDEVQDINHDLSLNLALATVNAIQDCYRKHVRKHEDQGRQLDIFDMEGLGA